MALTPPLPTITDNDLFDKAFQWEPKYTNRFIMYIADIPAYLVRSAGRPSITNGSVVTQHINVDRKLKGKSTWNDITITLYDAINPSGAQAVMDWVRLHHESATGRDGYASDYKKDLEFYALSPMGEKIEHWIVYGALIDSTSKGDMDWTTEGAVEISLTLKYDWALLDY